MIAVIGAGACVFTALALCALFDSYRHWFIIPVTLGGMLVTSDALSLLKKKLRVYEPAVLTSLYGIHFFFLAPLLHVYYDYWVAYVPDAPEDWRPWLGGMALFNLFGLLLYRFIRDRFILETGCHLMHKWVPRRHILAVEFLIVLPAAALCQMMVYARFGGISGYVSTFEGKSSESFAGLGLLFAASERFPILAFIALCVFLLPKKRQVSMSTVTSAITLVLVLSLVFGGLRGSRTLIATNVLWAAGIVHLALRPLSKRAILVGLCGIVVFLYAYGFYKYYGLQGMDYLRSDSAVRDRAAVESGRTFVALALGDLGRSGIQALTLYRLWKSGSDYQYAWGSTYLHALSIVIPRQLRPSGLTSGNKAGMEMAFGTGTYIEGSLGATWVYGLAGEAMMNFTPWTIPLAFGVLGALVGSVQKWYRKLPQDDLRWYVAPQVSIMTLSVLTGSASNLVYSACTTLLLPSVLLRIGAALVVRSQKPSS